MKKTLPWIIILALVGAGTAWYWQTRQGEPVTVQTQEPEIAQPARRPEPEPIIEHPVEDIAVEEPETEFFEPEPEPDPLPALADSDPHALDSLSGLFGPVALGPYLVPEAVIPRIVATVDNLPNSEIAPQINPVQPVEGDFGVIESGIQPAANPDDTPLEVFTLTDQNQQRYTAMVELIEAVDTEALVASYVANYPLFQQAYQELGYPTAYFNDRLVAVIEHMLEAPEIGEPITLTRPEAFYVFTDPELEALSAGHKIMVRMGPDNAARVKDKLRAILYALTNQPPVT